MTVQDFIIKWRKVELKERSAAQEHFLDLCAVFDHPTPAAADPTGEMFCFEKGAAKHGGADCHARLDAAAAAYGWPSDLPDEAILERLLEMKRYAANLPHVFDIAA